MKKLLILLASVMMIGCENEQCQECVETITVEIYSNTSSLIKREEEEIITVLCDESDIEGVNGAFGITENNVGNQGYYKVTTTHTICE